MKKILKKFICAVVIISNINIIGIRAEDKNLKNKDLVVDGISGDSLKSEYEYATKSNCENILEEFGFDKQIIPYMDEDDKMEIARAILREPDKVQLQTTVMEIDEYEIIEEIVNSSDKELQEMGMSQSIIDNMREEINELSNMTDSEIAKRYNKNNQEIKLIRMALLPDENYEKRELEGNIVNSSTISTDKLAFSTAVYDNTKSTCKELSYGISNTFSWTNSPVFTFFTDEITVGWGGNLATLSPSASGKYLYGNMKAYKNYISQYEDINLSYRFVFPQKIQVTASTHAYLTSGTASLSIYQNEESKNRPTKVATIYAHGVISLSGVSVTVSKSDASITLNLEKGWDYTNQNTFEILY